MSSKPMRVALLLGAFALVPAAWPAQPAADVVAPSMLDVPIEDIAATENGRVVLDKDFPELRTHAMYDVFKSMSLNQIAAMSHGRITRTMLAQARTDLSALPVMAVAQPVTPADIEDPAPPPNGSQAAFSTVAHKR